MRRTATVAAVCGVLALSGCTIPGFTSDSGAGKGTTSTSVTGPWKTVQRSSPPRPSPAPAPYVPSPSPTPGTVLSPPAAISPSPAICTGSQPRGASLTVDVTVSGTTATATWWHGGDTNIVEYRIAPVLQTQRIGDQRELVWTSVKPGSGCHELTATLTGLARGSAYEIWLDTVSENAAYPGRTVDLMVGRSAPVVIA